MDAKQQVVAIAKDRSVFPMTLVVTKISGSGADSVFLGVMRTTNNDDANLVKVWATPGGQILCADQRFSDWFGVTPADLVGTPFSALGADIEALDTCVGGLFVIFLLCPVCAPPQH